MNLFDEVTYRCSRLVTHAYSTSFSIGIRCLGRPMRQPIYAIYGFVRLADEIVDSFHEHDKATLLSRFREDTYRAIEEGISLNPILHAFQSTVHRYSIDREVIDQFLHSMEMDLDQTCHTKQTFEEYILGSAEVVGLMCLRVFCQGDTAEYERLKPFAMKLGSAFQKVNFLRDLKSDYLALGRLYFPNLNPDNFDESTKEALVADIEADFSDAEIGLRQLPRHARLGVYVALVYYEALLNKIRRTPAEEVLGARIRVKNRRKLGILAVSYFRHQLGFL
jgi:phytoene/squalene synthetase